MTALADRIGEDAMVSMLRDFIKRYADKIGSWKGILASLRHTSGAKHARWLREWLNAPGAPDLRFADASLKNNRFMANLTQTTVPTFRGTVEIDFVDSTEKTLATHRVDFGGKLTDIDIPVPKGAQWVRLDPNYRLPRNYDLDKSKLNDRTQVYLQADFLTPLGIEMSEFNNCISTIKEGPAKRAGMVRYRIDSSYASFGNIVAVNGKPTDSWREVFRLLSAYSPGDQVEISQEKHGKKVSKIRVVLPKPCFWQGKKDRCHDLKLRN